MSFSVETQESRTLDSVLADYLEAVNVPNINTLNSDVVISNNVTYNTYNQPLVSITDISTVLQDLLGTDVTNNFMDVSNLDIVVPEDGFYLVYLNASFLYGIQVAGQNTANTFIMTLNGYLDGTEIFSENFQSCQITPAPPDDLPTYNKTAMFFHTGSYSISAGQTFTFKISYTGITSDADEGDPPTTATTGDLTTLTALPASIQLVNLGLESNAP